MKSFSIDAGNNITAFAADREAEAASGEAFGSEAELHKLTANWPTSRLVEIWNTIPGFTRVKKFTDRKTAVTRIWKAIQGLGGGIGARTANVALDNTTAGKKDRRAQKDTLVGQRRRVAKTGKPAPTPKASTAIAREGSKTAKVLAMLQQSHGATLKQLMKATGWQAHSVRGFISGTLGKKTGLAVASTKGKDGERRYSVKA